MTLVKNYARRFAFLIAGIGVGLSISAHSEIANLLNPSSNTSDFRFSINHFWR